MTRRHFEAIAASIREDFDSTHSENGKNAIRSVTERLAETLGQFNSNFNRDKFLSAALGDK